MEGYRPEASAVEQPVWQRAAEVAIGTAAAAGAVYCGYKGFAEIADATRSVQDGVGLAVNGASFKWGGGFWASAGASFWALSRAVNPIPAFDKSPDNRRVAQLAVGVGAVLFGIGTQVPTESSVETTGSFPPAASTVPGKAPTVLTNPPESQTPVTTLEIPTSESSVSAACQLVFADDGDGFFRGDTDTITNFQIGLNNAGYEIPIDGALDEADLAIVDIFKTNRTAELGDAFVTGPQGQVTPQMTEALIC
jgi:hypothetical protein